MTTRSHEMPAAVSGTPGPACSICVHRYVLYMDEALVRGASCPQVASRYGVSVHALRRHRVHHLRGYFEEVRAVREEEHRELGMSFLDQLRDLHDQTLVILGQAERGGSVRDMLAAVREARRSLELVGRLTAAGSAAPAPASALQVNILVVLQQVEIRNAVLQALEPYPEARCSRGLPRSP